MITEERLQEIEARVTHYLLHGVGDATDEAVEGNHLAEHIKPLVAEVRWLRDVLNSIGCRRGGGPYHTCATKPRPRIPCVVCRALGTESSKEGA